MVKMKGENVSDYLADKYPVSIKGVLAINGLYPLLRNERDEWELPGGRLERGETIIKCLEREVLEELNINAKVNCALNNWVYHINGADVVIITYRMELVGNADSIRYSHEHKELKLFSLDEARKLPMPKGYLESLALHNTLK